MRYQRVRWVHEFADEPVLLFAEIDDEGWEVRKVDQYADGTLHRAGGGEETERTVLGERPGPTLDVINQDPDFNAEAITAEEFETVWITAGRSRLW
jgi:hypothetical protein